MKEEIKDLIEKLRKPANWMAEDRGQHWKDARSRYDKSPFEAADLLERLLS